MSIRSELTQQHNSSFSWHRNPIDDTNVEEQLHITWPSAVPLIGPGTSYLRPNIFKGFPGGTIDDALPESGAFVISAAGMNEPNKLNAAVLAQTAADSLAMLHGGT